MVSQAEQPGRLGELLRPDDPQHLDGLMFLMMEAELLDGGELDRWLGLLAPEMSYRIPVQTTRLRDDARVLGPRSFLLDADRATLEFRVRRLMETDAAWSENPWSRIRRFVSNVRVRRADGDELRVGSYLLVLRSRHDLESYNVVSAERVDVLGRDAAGALKLRSRVVVVDQARLGMASLPFPL